MFYELLRYPSFSPDLALSVLLCVFRLDKITHRKKDLALPMESSFEQTTFMRTLTNLGETLDEAYLVQSKSDGFID